MCGSCGAQFHPGANFCSECGARLTRASLSAEYKQVTVLFADVVRSMDIAATLDMERMREIITELVERSATAARRYGGTVEYTGDGVMALFGAPIALEDHAFRGCLAAMAIQQEAHRLAGDVARRDGVALQLRVGLNSGRVIAGEIGSGALGYSAIGQHVGMAQRMESAAPPGGVLLSESTARLVEHKTVLADLEWVHIKGSDKPVAARRLTGIELRHIPARRTEANLVGRRWEMAAIDAMVDRALGRRGSVVNIVGPPGIGKSRTAREAAALASSRGFEVFWSFCEAHASDIPFQVVTQLLRVSIGVSDLDAASAREKLRAQFIEADSEDLLLLDDLLGIADPEVSLPQIDPGVRKRRLTTLINNATLGRTTPTLYIIEDAHWVDPVSESMLADFISVIPNTPSMVLITARTEYSGALLLVHEAQTIFLDPLADSDTAELIDALLGRDPSVGELAAVIADRAAGNPFFAEEMVRELDQRGVLIGEHGSYICRTAIAEVSVPATVQAAVEARIDRLSVSGKRMLNAAAVIGIRFEAELVTELGVDPVFDELIGAELIDPVGFSPQGRYAFRHPLIRAVAYESQLKSDRAEWHLRVAAAIQAHSADALEENAILIAEHLQAADELPGAYGWHMRAGAWSTNRDIDAARRSWERARSIADQLPGEDADHLSMRIAPRTMLYATVGWSPAGEGSLRRFEELRELCNAAGDKVSLAVGMTGAATELLYAGRSREASPLASEQMALLESIGDPDPTVGLAFVAFNVWFDAGEFGELSKWTQAIIDLADDDPARGAGFGLGSPLAAALAMRGAARWWLGRPQWLEDLHGAVLMAQNGDPETLAAIVTWSYGHAITYGALRVDDSLLRTIEQVVPLVEGTNDVAACMVLYTLAIALLNRDDAGDRRRGLEMMRAVREQFLGIPTLFLVPLADVFIGQEEARSGDRDVGVALIRQGVDVLRRTGRLGYGVWGASVLVEALLDRGHEGDTAEAEEAVDWLTHLAADQDWAILEIMLLRLNALLARGRGDAISYRQLAMRYCTKVEVVGFDGHIARAKAMVSDG
ncbi:cyclase [Mycobacterium sp. EPa45]|nr:adenylate/guanylate cyclase domain-containing protein [Mycobacterium sp. EPa45]AKK30186.1 cyclase [Mycobacterium sp. EPa45]